MNSVRVLKTAAREQIGEIDSFRTYPWLRDDVLPPEIWPGKFTDPESLERNARYYRSLERRRLLRKIFTLFRDWLRSGFES